MRRGRRLAEVLRDEVGAEERQPAGDRLEQRDAERVEVGGDRDRRAGDLLGRHVRERADQAAGLGLAEVDEVRDAEVAELRGAARVEEDVRRLDVAVHDAAVVRRLEPADDVERHPPDLRPRRAARPTARRCASEPPGRYSITRKPRSTETS